ncbi:hypothetical protein GQ473_04830 [archaeon]|nr:hypothetical protein [archaeon]
MTLGIYTVLAKENLIKKIIGLTIFTNGIHLFLIALGYFQTTQTKIAPILTTLNTPIAETFANPLPQALVLTSIVIDLSITALAAALIIQIHKKFKTVSAKKLNRLKG